MACNVRIMVVFAETLMTEKTLKMSHCANARKGLLKSKAFMAYFWPTLQVLLYNHISHLIKSARLYVDMNEWGYEGWLSSSWYIVCSQWEHPEWTWLCCLHEMWVKTLISQHLSLDQSTVLVYFLPILVDEHLHWSKRWILLAFWHGCIFISEHFHKSGVHLEIH